MAQRICVFCGSNPGARDAYRDAAIALAQHLVSRNITLVFGGGNAGLMGVLADSVMAAGGEAIGIMPRAMVERERAHRGISELRIVGSMHERKAMMYAVSDAFLAMPGGYGTFEEFCEVLTWTQLGLQQKPCGILNVANYFDHLLTFFDHAVTEQFVKPAHRQMVLSDSDPASLVERLLAYQVPRQDKVLTPSET